MKKNIKMSEFQSTNIEKVKIMFEYISGVATGNHNFEFNPRDNELKMIENFTIRLTPSHGDEWIFNYMCFQFSRYIDLKTRFGKGKIMIGWVIGQKAFNKYKEAPDEEKYWGEVFKTRFNLRNPLNKPLFIEVGKSYKNRERKRFNVSERQFLHCEEMNLFDEKSKICMFCKNKELCRK